MSRILAVMAHLDSLDVVVHIPHLDPQQTYRCFVDPSLLSRWWPDRATTDPQFGGNYHLEWPGPDWHLRGTYIETVPGESLAFTWQWDHEPEIDRRVDVAFGADPGGRNPGIGSPYLRVRGRGRRVSRGLGALPRAVDRDRAFLALRP